MHTLLSRSRPVFPRACVILLLAVLLALGCGAACADDAAPDPRGSLIVVSTRTPAPTATPRPTRTPTPVPTLPPVVNRASHPEAWPTFAFEPDEPQLHVVFPAIHDADAALILCDGEAFLIDCADYTQETEVVYMLWRMGITRLKGVLITHPHHDHTEGFAAVARAVAVEELLICFPEDENERMETLMGAARVAQVPVRQFGDGDVFTVGDAELTVWLKATDPAWNLNDRSAVTMLRWHGRSMLFTADIEYNGMKALTRALAPGELHADLLKFPHHAVNGVDGEFLMAVDPRLCIVTNRDRNTPGEQGLRVRHMPYVCTRYGGLVCTTDGTRWLVERLIPNWRGHLPRPLKAS